MSRPEAHNPTSLLPPKTRIPLRWGDLLLPALMLGAFLVSAAVITVTDTASAYGGYLAILFVGMTYALPWNRASYIAAGISTIALFYWYGASWMSQQDALAGLSISLITCWVFAIAISHIQQLEGEVDTRDQQLDLAMEVSDVGIFHWDLNSNRVFAQGRLRDLWGITDDGPIYSRDIFSRIHKDDRADAEEAIGVALRGEGDYSAEFRIIDERTGRTRWLLGRGRVINAIRSRRLYLTGTNLDITSIKEEEMRIRSILNGLGMLAGLLTPKGELIEANSAALETANLKPEDVIGQKFWETYWWAHDRIEQSRLQQAVIRAAEGETVQYDATIRTGEDEFADIAFFLSAVHNAHGDVIYLVPSAIDITERKKAERQVNLLVEELNHRIKNLFSVTNALINLSARHAVDVDSFVQATLKRLQALHASHTMTGADVTRPQSFYARVDAESLARKIMEPYRSGSAENIRIAGNGMQLNAGQATAFSLILNELAANSVKHGSMSAENGTVALEWSAPDGGFDEGFRFNWRETGGPPVGDLEGKGFGHSIISLLTRNYLSADCTFGSDDDGFSFDIDCKYEDETIDE